MVKLKYVDKRRLFFPALSKYPAGISLPRTDNIVEVTEEEAEGLMKMRNGNNPIFEKGSVRRVAPILEEAEE